MFCVRTCAQSTVDKQSSGVQEQINPFYIEFYRENGFGLRTFWCTNDLRELIKFENPGSIVYILVFGAGHLVGVSEQDIIDPKMCVDMAQKMWD